MNRLFGSILLGLSVVCAGAARSQPASVDASASDRIDVLESRSLEALEAGDFKRASEGLREVAAARPKDPFVHYNLACALAAGGETDQAIAALTEAIAVGFIDFFHMERDPHLASLKPTARYQAIVLGWGELMEARGASDHESLKAALGHGYTFERDAGVRLNYASAFDAEAFETAKREIVRVARWAARDGDGKGAELFPAVAERDARPDAWVSVVLPSQKDFIRIVMSDRVGGVYDRDRKRLISRDVGPSLRHEFFHVLHWRHMDRLGQEHPYWIMEGMAALVEDVGDDGEGGIVVLPSWRTNTAKRLADAGRLTPWKTLFALDRERFLGDRARAFYAQSRAVFMYMLSMGKLEAWYRTYTEGDAGQGGYAADATGGRAIEVVFGSPLQSVEKDFRKWVRGLEVVGETAHPGEAGLGATVQEGAGDGVVISRVVQDRGVGRAGPPEKRLRMRDVVVAIDGEPTPTLDDYYRVLSARTTGERVTVQVRRGALRLEIEVELRQEAAGDEEIGLP